LLGISPETARLADDRALLFQGLDAHGRTAVLALMDADSLNTQPRARRGPAPSHPGSQLSSGYAIEWRTLAKAFAELLVAAHDILAHPLARTAPFEHDARHAKQLEELASSIRRDLELGRAVAARALALGDLAHVFETARDEWPKPRDRTAARYDRHGLNGERRRASYDRHGHSGNRRPAKYDRHGRHRKPLFGFRVPSSTRASPSLVASVDAPWAQLDPFGRVATRRSGATAPRTRRRRAMRLDH